MPDRGKVIKGLECCSADNRKCNQCPYDPDTDEAVWEGNCAKDLAHDALELLNELLKEQKPRVLTVEEVRSKQTKAIPVWKETKSKNKALYVGWVLAYEVQTGQGITGDCLGMAEPSGRMVWYKLSDYGKTWRVWSARPTDAQREVVKWDDDANPYL